jgi:hypothetical protein
LLVPKEYKGPLRARGSAMLELQRAQFEHDERFHREIARLSLQARINHMALHFCKYTGRIACACSANDKDLRALTIVDSFIICLATANALNVDLEKSISTEGKDLISSGLQLAERLFPGVNIDDHWLFSTYAIEAGKLARACEKIDHLEPFPFREALVEALTRLCEILLIGAVKFGIDLLSAISDRRKEIRRRNPTVGAITSTSLSLP